MKHLLNNISEEEKNRIREQHTGGMRIATDKFKKLVETKQGDVKLYLNEQPLGASSINDINDIYGKDVNFYSDKANRELISGYSPSTIKGFGTNPKGEFDMFIEFKGSTSGKGQRITFNCQNQYFTISGIGGNPNFHMYVNKNLTELISGEVCNKNDAGMDVPKADFASTDGGDNSNMA